MALSRLVLAAHNGFAARYLFRTAILSTLRSAGAETVLLVPDPDEEYLRQELGGDGVTFERFRVQECSVSFRDRRVLETLHSGGTSRVTALNLERLASELERMRGRLGLRASLTGATAALLRRSRAARRLLQRRSRRLLPQNLHREALLRHRPDAVVVTSPGYLSWPADAALIEDARRLGIPSIAAIYAWDNPSTKGLPLSSPTFALAWSETMRQELASFADLDPATVRVTGPAIFDVYAKVAEEPREALRRQWGASPDERLVFFGTMSPFQFPHNLDYARAVAAAIAAGKIPGPCRMVARLHPIYHRDAARRTLERERAGWERLAADYPFVRVWTPRVLSDRLTLDMPVEEMVEVAGLVRAADVIVSFFSTLQLEAALADTPFVAIAYDPPDVSSATRRPSRFARHDHNHRTVASGAGLVAASEQELVASIAASLADRNARREARRRLALAECAFVDGGCGRRAAEAILELAGSVR